ncbi:hypothetical protein NPIL_321781 [Nephila pilipes]|uniref:Uncharacterized protein n=1 Tax=Nephila pilipes TaxID=299642 RepID=A0A8X6QIA2_NEPPI|nr:hypothetical protein NPIL_321781 [Nephila pilipes]
MGRVFSNSKRSSSNELHLKAPFGSCRAIAYRTFFFVLNIHRALAEVKGGWRGVASSVGSSSTSISGGWSSVARLLNLS